MTAVARRAAGTSDPGRDDGAPTATRPRWWLELVGLAALYVVYSATRNLFGSGAVDPQVAYANALDVIEVERALGLYHEAAVQELFLDHPRVLWAWNVFYGTFHFLVPVAVLVGLWRRAPGRYRHHRNALVATTLLALIGFSLYPLMPPRLLCECPGGAGVDHGFVDTLAVHGGLWSFDSGTMQEVSNQYAAMPSLHVGWALWCALAVAPLLSSRRWRLAAFAYPAITLLAVVVTANHFVVDAVGSLIVVAAGWGIADLVERAGRRRRARAATGAVEAGGVVVSGVADRYGGQ